MAEKSHAWASHIPTRFERDMGYALEEFFDILPSAISDFECLREGNSASIVHPGKQLQLRIDAHPLPDRMIGPIGLPHIEVQFEFENMNDEQRAQFMRRFDQRFQRGGG